MAETADKTNGIKKLKESDLNADDLAKEIEKSTKALSKSEAKAEKPAKSDKPDKVVKPADSPPDEDKGVPIIVKRNTPYIATNEGQAAAAEVKPPSQTQKVIAPSESTEPKPEADQPADTVPAVEPAKTETAAETDKPPPAEPEPVEPLASKPKVASQTTPTEKPLKAPDKPATTGAAEETDEEQPLQKPTVFDTNQYHLPIKARSHHYVNNVAAWLVLLVALAATGAYVLNQLGVITPSDFGF